MIFFQNRLGSVLEFLVGNLIHLHLQQFLFLILLCRAQCITDISLQRNKKPIMPCFFQSIFYFWLKRKIQEYGCESFGSEMFDVKNDQERYCHFGALVRAPQQLITANFFFYTFTFYHFALNSFHFSSLSLSIILPEATFTFHHFYFQ